MRLKWSLAAAAILSMVPSACGGSQPASSTSSGPVYHIKYSGPYTESDPSTVAMHEFKTLVESRSHNRLRVDLFPNGQLGAPAAVLDQQRSGSLEMVIVGNATYSSIAPVVELPTLPFLFKDMSRAVSALNGPAGQPLVDAALGKNIRILAFEPQGYDTFDNRKHQAATLADLKGLNIRSAPDKIFSVTLSALGVHPTPLAFTDVPAALSSGVIDGDYLAPVPLLSSKEYELAPYVTFVSMQMTFIVVSIGTAFYNSLPSDLQKIVSKAAVDAAGSETGSVIKLVPTIAQTLQSRGAHVVTVSADEQSRWADMVKPVVYGQLLTDPAQKAIVDNLAKAAA